MTTNINTIVSSTSSATREAGFGAAIISKLATTVRRNLTDGMDTDEVIAVIAKAGKVVGLDRNGVVAILTNLAV